MRYFKPSELKCKCCGVMLLADGFAEALDALREAWGRPLTVTSGCRCASYNAKIGGAKASYHVMELPGRAYQGTCAVDIAMPDGSDKLKFVQLAIDMGWTVGAAKTFVHLDRRTDCAGVAQIMFTY